MSRSLMLRTNGFPLGRVREFLERLWATMGLEGMMVPIADQASMSVEPRLIEDPSAIVTADPFAPVMTANTVKVARQLSRTKPGARIAVVLRPCEARAFDALITRNGDSLADWFPVGIECVCAFPSKDYAWRVEKAGSVEALTEEVLRFSMRGGIAPYRYRRACQSCSPGFPAGVDVRVGVIGVPAAEWVLVTMLDDGLAERLVRAGALEEDLGEGDVARRERQLIKLRRQREAVRERMVNSLGSEQPRGIGSFIEKLEDCQPCTKCLQVCPTYAGEPEGIGKAYPSDEMAAWLASCAQCGMCEEVCPDQTPLAAVHSFLLQRSGVEALVG